MKGSAMNDVSPAGILQNCIGWMRTAGFTDARSQPLDGPNSVVVATK
jgi:hypothetical protein